MKSNKRDGRSRAYVPIKPAHLKHLGPIYASQDPNLIALRDEWYQRLKDEGFIDCETYKKGIYIEVTLLKHTAFQEMQRARRAQELGFTEYYRMIASYLWEGTFTNALERRVWELHCEGWSYGRISAYLKKKRAKRYEQTWVHRTVQRIYRRMMSGDRGAPQATTEDFQDDQPGSIWAEAMREWVKSPDEQGNTQATDDDEPHED